MVSRVVDEKGNGIRLWPMDYIFHFDIEEEVHDDSDPEEVFTYFNKNNFIERTITGLTLKPLYDE